MAAEAGPTDDPLEQRLREGVRRFSFFQIVRLLEQFYRPAARIGREGPASREIIRFRPDVSLLFPASDLVEIERIASPEADLPRYRVTTSFLGLYGTTSPLPLFYTEEVLQRDPEGDTARAFIDLFHHRFISLFFRCWSKYRYPVQFDGEGNDEFSRRIFGLIGLGTPELLERTGIPSVRWLRYAGLMNQRPRSASALEGILHDFFGGITVGIEQCTKRWISIKNEQRNSLGRANCRLAIDASLGEKVLGRGGTFRISLGPMGYEMFLSFLPVGTFWGQLDSLVCLFVTDRLEFDIELKVRQAEIPRLQITTAGRSRLGWSSWLSPEGRPAEDVRSVVLDRSAAVAGAWARA